jgi:uncharacterized protein YfdQ (DUF2303 family)
MTAELLTAEPSGVENEVVARLAALAAGPTVTEPGTVEQFLVPAGYQLREVDAERLLDYPRRVKGDAEFIDPASFIDYVDRHQDEDHTTLWGDWKQLTLIAVLNDDTPEITGVAGWRDHRAVLTLRKTDEWADWRRADRQWMDQTAFASFLEDHVDDIHDPVAADMLELASTFTATENVEFRSAVRLQDGSGELRYVSDIEAGAGTSGDLTVPQVFTLLIRPFEGANPREVRARLRWRINKGSLAIGYQLIAPERVVQEAFEQVADVVHDATGLSIWAGNPPAAR